MEYSRDVVSQYSKQFKNSTSFPNPERKQFDKEGRNSNFEKYLRVVLAGMNEIQ